MNVIKPQGNMHGTTISGKGILDIGPTTKGVGAVLCGKYLQIIKGRLDSDDGLGVKKYTAKWHNIPLDFVQPEFYGFIL